MSRLYKLFSSRAATPIGLWDCQQCGVSHDAASSWVLTGTGADGTHADVVCDGCADDLRDDGLVGASQPRSSHFRSDHGQPTRDAASWKSPPLESAERP